LDRRDILAFVEEIRRQEEEENQKKLPGKLKIEGPKPTMFASCQPLIFTNTSVRLMQEKLKRQQTKAELQDLRNSLKRVPRAKQVFTNQEGSEKTKKDGGLQVKRQKKKKIVKKTIKKAKKEEDIEASTSISIPVTKIPRVTRSSKDEITPKQASGSSLSVPTRPISQCASSSSIASSHRSAPRSRPMFSSKKFISNWERRIVDEFRRYVNIPVLQAVYRQIFCLKCKICPSLGPPRLPTRAHFQRRHVPHSKIHLADLSGNQLLRLMAIFRPGVAQLTRLSTKSHRPRTFVGGLDGSDPFGVKLQRANRQRRPWIPYNQRKPKFQFVPQWRRGADGEEM
jgi:hypothetical protein